MYYILEIYISLLLKSLQFNGSVLVILDFLLEYPILLLYMKYIEKFCSFFPKFIQIIVPGSKIKMASVIFGAIKY